MTRWSELSDSGRNDFSTGLPSASATKRSAVRVMPRIATSGALMIGEKLVPPICPSDDSEKQPPDISATDRPLVRAFSAVRATSSAISPMLFLRSEEHTSELQSLMRISYDVFCLKNKKDKQ